MSGSQSSLPGESVKVVPASPESSLNVPNLKVEKTEDEKQSSASFCPNCVRLKRRILELEEELSRLRGEPRDMVGPPVSARTPKQHDQAPPRPEQGPIEDFQGMFWETPGGPKAGCHNGNVQTTISIWTLCDVDRSHSNIHTCFT